MRCIVERCSNTQRDRNEFISFHRFPLTIQRKTKWMSSLKLEAHQVYKQSVVCSEHFFESDYIETSDPRRRRLFPSATPHIDYDGDESIDSAAICINKFDETVLERVADTCEENVKIINNMQMAPPKNQKIESHAEDSPKLVLHSLQAAKNVLTKEPLESNTKLTASSTRKRTCTIKFQDFQKTIASKTRKNIKRKANKLLTKKLLESSDKLPLSSLRKGAAKDKLRCPKRTLAQKLARNELLKNQKIESKKHDNAQNESSLFLHPLPVVNKASSKIALDSLIKETLEASNELLSPSSRKIAALDKPKNRMIASYTNENNQDNSSLPVANQVATKKTLESLTVETLKCNDELPLSPPRNSPAEYRQRNLKIESHANDNALNNSLLLHGPLSVTNEESTIESLVIETLDSNEEVTSPSPSPIKITAQELYLDKPRNQKIQSYTNNNTPVDSSLIFLSLPVASKVSSKIAFEPLVIESLGCSDELSSPSHNKETTQDKPRNQILGPHYVLCDCVTQQRLPVATDKLPIIKKTLEPSVVPSSLSSSRQLSDQEKIRKLEERILKKNKRIKVLNQTVRRKTSKIATLTQIIKNMKSSNGINEKTSAILQKCLGEDDLIEVVWDE